MYKSLFVIFFIKKKTMPLVVLCGNPSSGKSNIAHALQEECLRRGGMVDMVNEESLHIDRNNGYKGVLGRNIGWRDLSKNDDTSVCLLFLLPRCPILLGPTYVSRNG